MDTLGELEAGMRVRKHRPWWLGVETQVEATGIGSSESGKLVFLSLFSG
jgi:hypothetical protein